MPRTQLPSPPAGALWIFALAAAFAAGAPVAPVGGVARAQQSRLELAPAGGASSVRRDALLSLRQVLRFVTTAQESYFADHASYTTDLGALRQALRRAWGDSVQVQILFANRRAWSATAVHPAVGGKSCVVFVGEPKQLPKLPVTAADGKPPAEEGVPICDEP